MLEALISMTHSSKITVCRVLMIGCGTWLIVALGVLFATTFVPPKDYHGFSGFLIRQPLPSLLNGFAAWDGAWFTEIAKDGYRYQPGVGSHVVFFPVYPTLGAVVSRIFCCDERVALLLISNGCFLAALYVLRLYVTQGERPGCARAADHSIWLYCVLPSSFFFRMAYSESLFLLLTVLVVYGMKAKWSDWALAALVGAATGTRAVGVVLVLVFAHYLWTSRQCDEPVEFPSGRGSQTAAPSRGFAALRSVCLLVVSCWGILEFTAYLWWAYADALAWFTNQTVYNVRPNSSFGDRIISLLSFEPIWSVFVPGSAGYWARWPGATPAIFSLAFANPIYFTATCALLAYGWRSRVLEPRDVVVGALLLAVPYVTKGHDNVMLGFARYSSAAYPSYIVGGCLLARLPRPLAAMGLVVSAVMMCLYSALFAAWFVFL